MPRATIELNAATTPLLLDRSNASPRRHPWSGMQHHLGRLRLAGVTLRYSKRNLIFTNLPTDH